MQTPIRQATCIQLKPPAQPTGTICTGSMEQLSEHTVTLDTRKPNLLSLVAKATGQRWVWGRSTELLPTGSAASRRKLSVPLSKALTEKPAGQRDTLASLAAREPLGGSSSCVSQGVQGRQDGLKCTRQEDEENGTGDTAARGEAILRPSGKQAQMQKVISVTKSPPMSCVFQPGSSDREPLCVVGR